MMPRYAHPRSGIIKSTLLVAGLFMFIGTNLFSQQDDCASKIQEAQKLYDLGNIEEIPQMLAPCMEEGFTRTQRIEAFKLIILSYLLDDNQVEAEKTMVEFLKKYPEYEIMPNDPVEFRYLFESYRTTSVFSFGLTGGFNLTDPRIMEPFTLFDMNQTTSKNHMKPGFHLGVGVGRYISRKMLLNFEFNFAANNYSFSDEIRIPVAGSIDAINSVTYLERLYKIEWPLTLVFEFNIKKMHYSVRGGLSASKITSIAGHPSRKYSEELPAITSDYENIGEYRKNVLYAGIIGANVRYKVPRGIVNVDLRVNIGLNNIVRPDRRYDNQDFITKFYYLDDDFSINTVSLSAGYYFSFYKPKKQR
jgi:hypothetical protein